MFRQADACGMRWAMSFISFLFGLVPWDATVIGGLLILLNFDRRSRKQLLVISG